MFRCLFVKAIRYAVIATAGVLPLRAEELKPVLTDAFKAKMQGAIKDTLKDPESARFKFDKSTFDISPTNGFGEVCVLVNARNAYGAYVGFRYAWLNFFQEADTIVKISIVGFADKTTDMNCASVRKQIEALAHHDPAVSDDQVRAGCSMMEGKLFCPSPGTGMCWEKGHNPWKGETPARALDIGNGPSSPDFDHPERCG